jgi:hypothetical protein
MAIVLFRSLEGFGDRLQILAHCLHYCKLYDATLCVDWSDIVWGNGKYDFNDFFEIVGIKTISKDKVLKKLQKHPQLKITPSCWTYKKIKDALATNTYVKEYGCFNHFEKIEGDVLVTNGLFWRTYRGDAIAEHLRIRPHVIASIQNKLKHIDFNASIIHLRGTDKNIMNMASILDDLKEYKELLYVITDDVDLFMTLHNNIPNSKLLNEDTNIMKLEKNRKLGTHFLFEPELKKYNIRKYDMILDLLVDWVALLKMKNFYGNLTSAFYETAVLLRNINYKKIINE